MLNIDNNLDTNIYLLNTWFRKVAEHRAAKRFVYDQPCTPLKLIGEITDKIPMSLDSSIGVMFTIEWAMYLEKAGYCDITLISDKYDHVMKQYCDKIIGCEYMTLDEIKEKDMKFDVVVGNPPYQKSASDGGKKTEPIWHLFVEKSLNILKDGGHLGMVHPSGWRNVDGKFKNTQKLLMENTINYLEMHDAVDGTAMFGVSTTYDWYSLEKTPNVTKSKTTINNGDYEIYINSMQFIPNGHFSEISNLIATHDEARTTVLHSRGAYGSDNGNMSEVKDEVFCYPCAMNVGQSDEITKFWYSNTDRNGHFGTPKIIMGMFGSGLVIDPTGEYGLCQNVSAIVDDVENLENIKKAMQSEKFLKISALCSTGGVSRNLFNYKALATFRKDFWKDFI